MADGEITISELELSEELLADMVIPVETSTDTKSATLAQLRSWLGTSLPIGSIFASVGKIDDARFTLLDGKTLSATGTYAEFYLKAVEKVQAGKWQSCTEEEFNQEVSQYGQCMKFVISNDYVRIPKAGNSLYSDNLFGADLPVVGNGLAIGLSNGRGLVTSNTNYALADLTNAYGKNINMSGGTFNATTTAQNTSTIGITTDPSNSGIIAKTNTLGNNTIVYYYMVISTEGQTEQVEIDVNQIYEDMELKANKSFSNIDNEGKSLASGWGMPSSRYIDLTLGASGSTYTAPANGWIYCSKQSSGTNQNIHITINGYMRDICWAHASILNLVVGSPIKKGETFNINYTTGGTTQFFKFIYAEGEN